MQIKTTKEICKADTAEDIMRHFTNDKWVKINDIIKEIEEFRDGFEIPNQTSTPVHWQRIDTLNMLIKKIKKQLK